MEIVQKGYGEVHLSSPAEVVSGEITIHDGWVAVVTVPPNPEDDKRWFPVHRVAEIIWRKSVAMRRA